MVEWTKMTFEEKAAFLQRVYKGETNIVDLTGTPFEEFTKIEWIRYFIDKFGGYDGAHHKDWVLDQVMRISFDTPVIVMKAVWDGEGFHDENWRVSTGVPSEEYLRYVSQFEDGEYDCGVAP